MANITVRTGKNNRVSYLIRVFVGTDVDGKKKFKSMTWKPKEGMTKRQIEKELQAIAVHFEKECLRNGKAKKKATFQFLADEWLKISETTGELNISTAERMKLCCNRIYSAMGDTYIDELKYRQIQNFIMSLAENGVNQRTGGGLSEKTQKHYITFISDVFNYAIKCEFVSDNPCKNVKAVKDKSKHKQGKDCYTIEQIQIFLELLKEKANLQYNVMFHLFIYYAMRRGEVLGLEWKDIDYINRTISIERTSKYSKKLGIYTDTTKNEGSTRIFEISYDTIQLLQRYKAEQDKIKAIFGNCWIETDRLFVTDNGSSLHPNVPYNWLERFCNRYGLPFKGLHAFRHSNASIAIASGRDIKTVSCMLGHSQTSTTLNIYTHEIKQATASGFDTVADIINGKKKIR